MQEQQPTSAAQHQPKASLPSAMPAPPLLSPPNGSQQNVDSLIVLLAELLIDMKTAFYWA